MMHAFVLNRNWIDSKRVLHYSMVVFLLGVYFFPTENPLKNFCYAMVLTPFLLMARTAEFKRLLESKLFLAVETFVFYIDLSINWKPVTRQSEYLNNTFEWMIYIERVMTLVSIAIVYPVCSFPTFSLGSWDTLYRANTGASCYAIAAVVCSCHFNMDDSGNKHGLYILILAILMLNISLTLSWCVWLALISAYLITHMIRQRYSLILIPLGVAAIYIVLIKFDLLESSWYSTRGAVIVLDWPRGIRFWIGS